MGGDAILYVFFLGPPALSLAIAIGVTVSMFVRSRGQPTPGFAWPAIGGSVLLPLAAYPMLFTGGHWKSILGAMGLVWFVAGVFSALGLVKPPPPTRRWMFAAGIGSIVLCVAHIMFLFAFGRSLGQMH